MAGIESVGFDLRGKDWLTEGEAAHYCGVSLRQFQDHAGTFKARRHMGKKLYSKKELFDAIQAAPLWHQPRARTLIYARFTKALTHGPSNVSEASGFGRIESERESNPFAREARRSSSYDYRYDLETAMG